MDLANLDLSGVTADLAAIGGADLLASASIPDPGTGNGVDNNFGSIEPNDTPSQATPLGTATGPNVGVWVNGNTTSASDGADYFVFRSGPAAGMFEMNLCSQSGITTLAVTLWQVMGGQLVLPPVKTWTGAGRAGPAGMLCTSGSAPLLASTVYLLGVQTTGAGTYSA
jgi:hypothetical protein